MKYEELKEEIEEIGKIAATVPESLQEKCFELLLNHLLSDKTNSLPPREDNDDGKTPPPPPPPGGINLPAHVKAFMRRNNVTQQQIEAVVMIEDDEFHFIREPQQSQASKGQMEWALLVALKSGIQNNSLKADPEDIRSIVQEKGFYDSANFATNFKKEGNAALFRGALERQGDAQALSKDGETALASLIKKLSEIS